MSNQLGTGDSLVNTTTFQEQSAPVIAKLADGFVIAWQSMQAPEDYFNPHFAPGFDLYLQRYDGAGRPVGGETHVNTVAINDQVQPAIAATDDGGFTIAWASAREQGMTGFDYGVYFQRFDAQGARLGSESQANSYYSLNQEHPSIAALANGDFVVTWWSDGQSGNPAGLYMRRFGSDGSPLDPETRFGTATAGSQSDAAVTALANGGFVVAWDGVSGVYAQPFTAAGAAGAEVKVNTASAGGASQPAITALHDGGYVVAWQSSDADGYGIHLQRFAADGTAAGIEMQVNTTTSGPQVQPTLAALDDGGFEVAWSSADGSGTGVYSQRFDLDGHAVGTELRVNDATAGNQFDASIAPDGHNGFVATWTGQDSSATGVYAASIAAALAGPPLADPGAKGTVDTALIKASIVQVTGYSFNGGNLAISTAAGTQVFIGVERLKFDDAWLALDTQPGGHTWQAEALLWAGIGTAPTMSLLSQRTAAADHAGTMAALAQSMIDYYAPGMSTAALVTHLYTVLAHVAPTQEIVQSIVTQVGHGRAFETQGDLFALAASLPANTVQFAEFTGTVQPLDLAWFGV